jgi:Cu(I)/Ag(I) efflux system membrane fusion protein
MGMKSMSKTQTIGIIGSVLTASLIFGLGFYAHGQQKGPGDNTSMPGMNMPAGSSMPGMNMPAGSSMPGMNMPATGNDASTKPDTAPQADRPPKGFANVVISPEVQQRIGVAVGKVEETPLTMNIRAVGIVRPNETKVEHIHLKTEGWIRNLFVSFTGQKVQAGDPLLSIYSPAFLAAQGEFLAALRSAKASLEASADRQLLAETARQRLELWDIPKDEIDKLEKTGKAIRFLTLRSPISGTVLEKKAFAGLYVNADTELYIVGDLSTVWVQAKVYQYELPHLELGMPATVSFPWPVMQQMVGKIVFIDPVVDEMTRTVQVRIELPNKDGQLKPGMFADVSLSHEMGVGLTVPTSAIIRGGQHDVAFLATPGDKFVPVQVQISPVQFGDRFQILDGLKAGDVVATSANFLIDSESRLQAGGGSMAGMPGMDMSAPGGGDTGKPAAAKDNKNSMDDMPGMDMSSAPKEAAPAAQRKGPAQGANAGAPGKSAKP